ncbi:MAG TPA: hypothetical protein VGC42_23750 [Kofleriaceae bacterium]
MLHGSADAAGTADPDPAATADADPDPDPVDPEPAPAPLPAGLLLQAALAKPIAITRRFMLA